MIYITGDTHARFDRFMQNSFPQRNKLSKKDYVIICGDFGGVWNGSPEEKNRLDLLETLPFTVLFITGNHENYDLLEQYPVEEWKGGKVQFIRPHVIHLMRGQVFTIDGRTFFTMGGAECHDIWNGVQDPADPDFLSKCTRLDRNREFYRVKGQSWWPQELPSEADYEEGWKNLRAHGMKVDYILTHCAPDNIQMVLVCIFGWGDYPANSLTEFLQEVSEEVEFEKWYFGHYHRNRELDKYYHVIYDNIEELE